MRSKACLSGRAAKTAVLLIYLVAVARASDASADDAAPGVSRTIAAVNPESFEQDSPAVPLPIPAVASTPSGDRSLQDDCAADHERVWAALLW